MSDYNPTGVIRVTSDTISNEQIRELWGAALDSGRRVTAKIAQIALGEWHGSHEFVEARDGYCSFVRDDGSRCGRMAIDDTIHIAAARVFCVEEWNATHAEGSS